MGSKRDASGLLALRKKSNLTLASVLWGNVAINVLLTLLPDSVLAGKPDARPKMARGSPGVKLKGRPVVDHEVNFAVVTRRDRSRQIL